MAIEHQDPATWRDQALAEKNPQAAIHALLALVRVSGATHCTADPLAIADQQPAGRSRDSSSRPTDRSNPRSLARLDWAKLTDAPAARPAAASITSSSTALGPPDEAAAQGRSLPGSIRCYPAKGRELNAELCQLLVYLRAARRRRQNAQAAGRRADPGRADRVRPRPAMLKTGWTLDQRKEYFAWFLKAANYKGGNSFRGFFTNMKTDAVATLTRRRKEATQADPRSPARDDSR